MLRGNQSQRPNNKIFMHCESEMAMFLYLKARSEISGLCVSLKESQMAVNNAVPAENGGSRSQNHFSDSDLFVSCVVYIDCI